MASGSTFRPIEREDEWLQVDVAEPGSGRLSIGHWQGDEPARWTTVAGAELGQLLEQMRATVLSPSAHMPTALSGVRVWHSDYRALLRVVEHAVLLAIAGQDRYERAFPRATQQPPRPLCINCNEGAEHHEVTVSMTCANHGHQPFGTGEPLGWERARERHQRDVQWWDGRHREAQQP